MDPLDRFNISKEDIDQVIRTSAERVVARDGRVCACGHPVGRHTEYAGLVSCKPARLECPCKKIRPAIDVPNTRYFMRKTIGNGKSHALLLGLRAAQVADPDSMSEVEWLIPDKCDKCGAEGKGAQPCNVTKTGMVIDEPEGYDVFLCDECRYGLAPTTE
jgi:hypothetical protein